MSSFTTPLLVKVLDNGSNYEVLETFDYYLDSKDGAAFSVESGFVTDFASVPRIFWSVFPPFGRYTKAAVLHDRLCVGYLNKQTYSDIAKDKEKLESNLKNRIIRRYEADKYFLESMKAIKVGKFTRYCLYFSVRLYAILKYGYRA